MQLSLLTPQATPTTPKDTIISGQLAYAPARYNAIHMDATAGCELASKLRKLVTIAERGCNVANTPGKAVDLTIELA